ncbi:hypothetical protein BD779DRAFT_1485460 [Infundibulicybe gibba]|nr:hypothetical protein BD779DRAFT_1485460 [Infundibulicybe gibba]
MSATIPKAVLYYSPVSIWSAVAHLNTPFTAKGENYDPSFLRLNPKATVPTLVVPLQKTLSEDVESRYKAITETKGIIEFLDKSRSVNSRTHTTSNAPAPALTPATIAFTEASNVIIEALHSEAGNPNYLRYVNARDHASLAALATELLPSLTDKHKVLTGYISAAENDKIAASEKTKNFWREKKVALEVLISVYSNADKEEGVLGEDAKRERADFFETAKTVWGESLKGVLLKVNQEAIGPYTLGDQYSIADLHLAGWLARVIKLAGTAMGKVESHIGDGFELPKGFKVQGSSGGNESKLAAFWDGVRARKSWKKVYESNGLY